MTARQRKRKAHLKLRKWRNHFSETIKGRFNTIKKLLK